MAGFTHFNSALPPLNDNLNSARALGDFNPNSSIATNEILPNDEFSSTETVPYTSKLEDTNREIPRSFDQYIGPPFKPIHIRELYDKLQTPNKKRRLTDSEVQAIVQNPNKLLPQLNRLNVLSDDANNKLQEKAIIERFYNMNFQQIAENIVKTVANVIDDIITFEWSDEGLEGLIEIFVKDDRLIYLGMVVMIFSILVMLIRETDR